MKGAININTQKIISGLKENKMILLLVVGIILVGAMVMNPSEEPASLSIEKEPEEIVVMSEAVFETEQEIKMTPLIYEQDIENLDFYESQMISRDFRQSLVIEKQVILLQINDTEILLSCLADAEEVLEMAVEEILKDEYDIEAEVVIENNQLSEIKFEDHAETSDAELLSIDVIESVVIREVTVMGETVLGTSEAVEYITKLKDTPETYTVVSGDVPSIIAEDNDMNLSDLYAYNPELKKDPTKLQIGDELVVVVPKPEISLKITEQGSYNTAIPKGYDYQNDSNSYSGTNTTLASGSDGVREVVATVEKINGTVVSRSIDSERTLQEPVNALISTGTKALPPKGALGTYISPLAEYSFTSGFGPRWNRSHRGIDLAAPTGTSVRASDGGVVTISGWKSNSYGYLVEINHGNGVITRYAHNSKLTVKVGDYVSQYQEIAKVGSTGNSTGPHCHFELIFDGVHVNPQDYLE